MNVAPPRSEVAHQHSLLPISTVRPCTWCFLWGVLILKEFQLLSLDNTNPSLNSTKKKLVLKQKVLFWVEQRGFSYHNIQRLFIGFSLRVKYGTLPYKQLKPIVVCCGRMCICVNLFRDVMCHVVSPSVSGVESLSLQIPFKYSNFECLVFSLLCYCLLYF